MPWNAQLTGFAPAGDSKTSPVPGNPAGVDPLEAFVGPGGPNPGQNSFGQILGTGGAPNYARADARLDSTLVNTFPSGALAPGAFRSVGETAVVGNVASTSANTPSRARLARVACATARRSGAARAASAAEGSAEGSPTAP